MHFSSLPKNCRSKGTLLVGLGVVICALVCHSYTQRILSQGYTRKEICGLR